MIEDAIDIGAFFYGGPETAKDIAEYSKKFLEYLETVSPWKRPFDVSGIRKSTAEIPVKEDFSNFYDLLFGAWKSSKKVYFDTEGVRTLKFSEHHTSPLGFSISFSDIPQGVKNTDRISIRFSMGHRFRTDIKGENVSNSVVISIRKFKEGERNSSWADRDVIEKIMLRLINELNPFLCSVWSSNNVVDEIDGVYFPYKFNWMTYITEKKLCSFLSGNRAASEFKDGLWLEFGRDVNTLLDPSVRTGIMELGREIVARK